MDSNNRDDEKTPRMRDQLLKLQQRLEKLNSDKEKSGSSTSISRDHKKINKEVKKLLKDQSKVLPRIHDDLDKVFVAEEVGHSCDLCQRDLARDPERPNATLTSLQEACVLACGHVYHLKCLGGTTLDLDNSSADPSCIFCIS